MADGADATFALGETDFTVRTDPFGPQAIPNDRAEEYQAHVDAGCFVYAGRQLETGGHIVYALWGPWP